MNSWAKFQFPKNYLLKYTSLKSLSSLVFPLALVFIVAVLVSLNISGSSIGVYESPSSSTMQAVDPLIGKVRPIRSDEWLVRTPWLLNQVQTGFQTKRYSGMGIHDVGIVGDLPTKDFDIVVKPHHVPLFIIGEERALAAEWWIWHVLMATGVYCLLLVFTGSKIISIAAPILLLSSPSTQWWAAPGTFTTVGYGSLACAAYLVSIDSKKRTKRYLMALVSGWLFACFACTLYIPWVITTTIFVLFVILAVLLEKIKSSKEIGTNVREILKPTLITAACSILLLIMFYLRHKGAIEAISSTVYPGERASESGGGVSTAIVFGAPFDFLAARFPTVQVNGTNQSENSSGIFYFLPVFIVSMWFLSQKGSFKDKRSRNLMISVLAVGTVFSAWLFLPINSSVGQFLLLDRIPPLRVLPAMTFVSLVALALLLNNLVSSGLVLNRKILISAIGVFAMVHIYAFLNYTINQESFKFHQGIPAIAYLSIALWLLFRKYLKTGLLLLLAFGVLQFSQVNPLQRGIRPLSENSVSQLVFDVLQENPKLDNWFLLGGDAYVRGSLEASPINLLSGVSRYPDRKFWNIFDPKSKYVEYWNRYGHIYTSAGPIGFEPQISSDSPDTISLKIDPCDSRLKSIGVDVIVTQNFEIGCHVLIKSTYWGDSLIRTYRN